MLWRALFVRGRPLAASAGGEDGAAPAEMRNPSFAAGMPPADFRLRGIDATRKTRKVLPCA
jgi:hypothetical protein